MVVVTTVAERFLQYPCIFLQATPDGGVQVARSASRSADITGQPRLDPVSSACTHAHLS